MYAEPLPERKPRLVVCYSERVQKPPQRSGWGSGRPPIPPKPARTPATQAQYQEPDVIEELGDDAIVAQQAVVHAPPQRTHVVEEAQTIMVSEQPPDPMDTAMTAQRPRYDPRRYDPTVVVRAVRGPLNIPRVKPPRRRTPGWVPWLIWGIAGLIAFAVGGFLAVWSANRNVQPAQPAPAGPEPPVVGTE